MVRVVGIRFRQNGKVYYFDPGDLDIKVDDCAIVETARGVEFGPVVSGPKDVDDSEIVQPLKPVIRVATEEDHKKAAENKEKEAKAFEVCLEKIEKHGLDMKLIDVEYTFDGNKILFYFTSDGRVDFRELVKDLAAVYRTRIELRQIGVRDETKAMGGYGICGREYCCHAFQSEFVPVSIRMAKDQNLSLNPTKISGSCGRLMCCIKYEEDTYLDLLKNLPRVGDTTVTEDGHPAVVDSINILRQKIRVIVDLGDDEKEAREYPAGKLRFQRKNKKNRQEPEMSAEELKELRKLEKE
ncbi:MAG: stage 0 sporulation family protein [Lachnospiraceae bacterium]|nr:stage 0 sporulation family protein [Lachnospiraceae bacterium]MBR6349731.1 stage 0 sporulation family protein [Lachnospiraceae bacterium]